MRATSLTDLARGSFAAADSLQVLYGHDFAARARLLRGRGDHAPGR